MRLFSFTVAAGSWLLASCGSNLITLDAKSVLVDPGQVFSVEVGEDLDLVSTVVPVVGTLPDGFSLQNQAERRLIFRASIYPGVYRIPYTLAWQRDGQSTTVSQSSELVVTVKEAFGGESIDCHGSRVRLSVSSNLSSGLVSSNGLVISIVSGPVDAVLRRKNAAGQYLAGSRNVTFSEEGLTALGTVAAQDFLNYPILEFDVNSADPADDWECSLKP